MALCFIEPELLPIEPLHCGNRYFRPFCSCDLDLDLMTFIYEHDLYSLEIGYRLSGCAKMNFLRLSFRNLSYYRHTDRHGRNDIPRHFDGGQLALYTMCCSTYYDTTGSEARRSLDCQNKAQFTDFNIRFHSCLESMTLFDSILETDTVLFATATHSLLTLLALPLRFIDGWSHDVSMCINRRTNRASWPPLTNCWARQPSVPSCWGCSVISVRYLHLSLMWSRSSSSSSLAMDGISASKFDSVADIIKAYILRILKSLVWNLLM